MSVTIEDTQDMALLHRLTQAAFAEYGKEAGTSTALKETHESIATQLNEGSRALVAQLGEQPVACVRYRSEGDALYFFRLSVDPAHRRKGLASALISHLEVLAQEAGLARLTCSVRLAKTDNVALYTGLGFQVVGTRSVFRDGVEVRTGDLERSLPHPGGTRPSPKGKGENPSPALSESSAPVEASLAGSSPSPSGEGVGEERAGGRGNPKR